jgi:hypothetical protein
MHNIIVHTLACDKHQFQRPADFSTYGGVVEAFTNRYELPIEYKV